MSKVVSIVDAVNLVVSNVDTNWVTVLKVVVVFVAVALLVSLLVPVNVANAVVVLLLVTVDVVTFNWVSKLVTNSV